MNERDIVEWSANPSKELPLFKGINDERLLFLLGVDESKLIKLLMQHRLSERFLSRFRIERPSWCNHSLITKIESIQRNSVANFHNQVFSLQEISNNLAPSLQPIVIKGFSFYSLTNQMHNIRHGQDVDLLFADLPSSWDFLLSLGYTGKRHYTHEYGKISRNNVTLDIHNYFPVMSYPKGFNDVNWERVANPSIWKQNYVPDLLENGIYYDDLLKHSCYGLAPGTESLRFPEHSMSVLLSCAHIFRHFSMQLHYFDERSALKIVELVEVREMLNHAEFDAKKFNDLVEMYRAFDCVDFTNDILNRYFGVASLPARPKMSTRKSISYWKKLQQSITPNKQTHNCSKLSIEGSILPFPEHLPFGGYVIPNAGSDPLWPRSMSDIVSALSPNVIPAIKMGDYIDWPHQLDEQDQPLEYCISRSWDEKSLRVSAKRNEELCLLKLSFNLPLDYESRIFDISIYFGGDRYVNLCVENEMLNVVKENKMKSIVISGENEGKQFFSDYDICFNLRTKNFVSMLAYLNNSFINMLETFVEIEGLFAFVALRDRNCIHSLNELSVDDRILYLPLCIDLCSSY